MYKITVLLAMSQNFLLGVTNRKSQRYGLNEWRKRLCYHLIWLL